MGTRYFSKPFYQSTVIHIAAYNICYAIRVPKIPLKKLGNTILRLLEVSLIKQRPKINRKHNVINLLSDFDSWSRKLLHLL